MIQQEGKMGRDVFAIVEHRRGQARDVTFEILTKARDIASQTGGKAYAVLLGSNAEPIIEQIKPYAERIIYIENEKLASFHSEYYQEALSSLIRERQPFLVLFGHTSASYDLVPALAASLEMPLITGCTDFRVEGDRVYSTNPVYGGKLNAEYSFDASGGGIVAILPGSVPPQQVSADVDVEKVDFKFEKEFEGKRFLQFIEAAAGEIDITQAEKIVAVGRGIKEEENLELVKDFADAIGAVLACTRPIVDAGWLPKERQVGSSGKTVKPKLYIALGISGAFQHVMGMKGSDVIIAVNKDPNAPIFNVAHYGIVDDLFKVVPALKQKILELKG